MIDREELARRRHRETRRSQRRELLAGVVGQSGGAAALLDVVGNAAAAYAAPGVLLSRSYSGPVIQQRVTISASPTLSNFGLYDAVAADAFAAQADPGTYSECRFYDESGNSKDTAFVVAANTYGLLWSPNRVGLNRNLRALSCDKSLTNTGLSTTQKLALPSGLVLNQDGFTSVFIGRETSAFPRQGAHQFELSASAGNGVRTDHFSWYSGFGAFGGEIYFDNASNGGSFGFPESGPGVVKITTVGATQVNQYVNDKTLTPVSKTAYSKNSAGGFLGWSGNTVPTVSGGIDFVAQIFYNRVLTAGEIEAVRAWAYALLGNPQNVQDVLVVAGESVVEGTLLPQNSTMIWQAVPLLNRPYRMWIDATSGATCASHHSTIARKTAKFSSGNRNLALVLGGYNDIVGGATPTQAAQNHLQVCADLKGIGFKPIAMTSQRVATSFVSLADQTTIGDYIAANWSGNADALADVWNLDTHIGKTANTADTAYYASDGIHVVGAGHAIFASYIAAAANALYP